MTTTAKEYSVILKCSCGFTETLMVMPENSLQIFIGSSIDGDSKLMLDCTKCGTKMILELAEKINGDVSTEICNEG